ncbi:hypothetical protein [Candidatus Lucifugimonas marina]|jgi:hypothetical protein|uniref:Uncharacterized protein n=1 Tax=Candidatus Lucifugimonas marina TaxID=3038979 RepID=A0AAJ5ZFW6_9CHLR|nr:hypothetical protein [SAR202 cluster bacterium JH702]MDG0869329.1 hypothetical protein [SAR202 cluster bacterium JH639]WFG36728.1 hypothetical protein GKN94_13930 [SAR202 cluster bacterium JH545]WFG40662.1 hypothetical protein GKO48_13975 [SAR202 cluster bacterium JH1073]
MFRFIGRRRPAVAGIILGTALGLMVAIGYGATSAWLCSGISKCPASWEPFVLISSIIFFVILAIMIVVSIVGARLYKIFDTSIGGEKAYEPSIGSPRDDD